MPDLVHIFLGIAAGIIVFSALLMHLFGKIVNQKREPASTEKVKPNITENQKGVVDSEINHVGVGINRFENELDEIYRKLEALGPLDEKKGSKTNEEEIGDRIDEKAGEETEEKIEEKTNEEKIGNKINCIIEEKEQKTDGSRHQDIYQAFDAGQTITELARNFKKNKGEIELILNLRGCDDREEKTNGYFDL